MINITKVVGIKSQAFCLLCDITEIGFVSKTGCTQRNKNKNIYFYICLLINPDFEEDLKT